MLHLQLERTPVAGARGRHRPRTLAPDEHRGERAPLCNEDQRQPLYSRYEGETCCRELGPLRELLTFRVTH